MCTLYRSSAFAYKQQILLRRTLRRILDIGKPSRVMAFEEHSFVPQKQNQGEFNMLAKATKRKLANILSSFNILYNFVMKSNGDHHQSLKQKIQRNISILVFEKIYQTPSEESSTIRK